MEASIFRIPLPDDYEGSVAATLVRFAAGRAPSRAVLYLHGYVDYFFQTHMARWFVARGWSFYALDLRKYGRSLEAGQTPYYCRDLHEYYPEIDRSIERMRQDRIERIVLMGHSTGGLLASLYASDGRRRADIERLILNSPFFEFNASWFKRRVAVPVAAVLGRLWPYAHKKNELSPFYFDSVYRGVRGEWDFDTQWKPRDGVPLYFIWLGAIRNGAATIAARSRTAYSRTRSFFGGFVSRQNMERLLPFGRCRAERCGYKALCRLSGLLRDECDDRGRIA